MKHWLILTLVVALSLIAAEGVARLWLSANHLAYAYPDGSVQPPALADASYWSPLFQQEQEAVRTHAVDVDGLPFAVDYTGQYVNLLHHCLIEVL